MILMWLVKAIDLTVGAVMFLFSTQRRHNPSVPMALGTLGSVALVAILLLAVGAPRVAYQVRTDAYVAEMANASGLSAGDPVYVAGVPAGQIGTIDLAGDHVRIGFRLDNAQSLGNRTTATVRLRTLLGKRFLDIMPAGTVDAANSVIPLERTTVPYSLDEVGRKAERAAAGVDQQALAEAMHTVNESIPDDNTELRAALAGISSASGVFAQNGAKIDELLRISRSLTDMLVKQNDTLAGAAADAARIVSTLAARRADLAQIVTNLTALLHELASVYRAKEQDFGDVITQLSGVTATLKANVDRIDQTLTKLPPAIRAITNATGNGNWADVNSPGLVMPDNLLCVLNIQRECR